MTPMIRSKATFRKSRTNQYVVGLRYENRLEYLAQVKKGDELKLVRELNNAFDPYAMAVYTSVDQKLGYIPSSKAFILSTLADEGWEFRCYAVHVYSAPRHPNRRLMVFIPPPSRVPNVTA